MDHHLPAPVWGHVLDYMPYGEVRSALLVGKHIALDAVQYVQVLNACMCQRPRASLMSTQSIFFLGFLQCSELSKGIEVAFHVANRSASYLAAFPKLENAFVGGLDNYRDKVTYQDECLRADTYPNNHEDIMRCLAESICGAYKTGALSRKVMVAGVIGVDLHLHFARACYLPENAKPNVACNFCRDIVKIYPIRTVLDTEWPIACYCLSNKEYWDALVGSEQWLKNQKSFFCIGSTGIWEILAALP